MDYTQEIALRVSDCGADGYVKLSAMLKLMQEMGEVNAGMLGCGRADLIGQNMCWVLHRLTLSFVRRPKMGDALRITTWPGGLSGLFFLRHFRFELPGGALAGEAVTTWVLFDIEKRRLLRPTALPVPAPVYDARACSLPMPDALDMQGLDPIGERIVRYTDLDMNGHMNNARYADWGEDALHAIGVTSPVRALQINYVAEARPSDTIALFAAADADGARVQGQRAGEPRAVFELKATY